MLTGLRGELGEFTSFIDLNIQPILTTLFLNMSTVVVIMAVVILGALMDGYYIYKFFTTNRYECTWTPVNSHFLSSG